MNRAATVLNFRSSSNMSEDLDTVTEAIEAAVQSFGLMRFCESMTFASEKLDQEMPIAA